MNTTRWLSLLRSEVPLGYEDEDGFHFGALRNQDATGGMGQTSLNAG